MDTNQTPIEKRADGYRLLIDIGIALSAEHDYARLTERLKKIAELVLEALSADRTIREYQLIVRKSDPADPDSMDSLAVRLEVNAQARARLAAEIPVIVQQVCMVRPEAEFAGPGEIHDRLNSLKSRMVIDERT